MTPKEKAKELIYKFCNFPQLDWIDAKQCSLISVNEIQKLKCIGYSNANDETQYDYWQEVKQEIQTL